MWSIFVLSGLVLSYVSGLSSRVDVTKNFFATTVPGLEHILLDEIKLLSHATNVQITSAGVSFQGNTQTGLEALLYSRSALKLMEKIHEGRGLKSKEDLYDLCYSVDWSTHIDIRNTIKCDSILGLNNPSTLSHSHFNALTMKNAIVDQFRSAHGRRPSVDVDDPDVSLLMYLHKANAVIYKVWSGESSLHKRGYRDSIHKAALRETTAAALVLAAGWDKLNHASSDFVFFDPLCGSGTIAIEAALIMARCAPGLLRYGPTSLRDVAPRDREGGFELGGPPPVDRWIGGDESAGIWDELYHHAQSLDLRAVSKKEGRPKRIYLNDVHPGAIELAVKCADKANVKHMLEYCCADIRDLDLRESPRKPTLPRLIVTNPPWDMRLSGDGVVECWRELESFANRNIHDEGGELWSLSGNPRLQEDIHLPISKSLKFSSAGLDVQLLCHEIPPL